MGRRIASVLIIAIAVGALAVLFLPRALQKRLKLRACFHDAGGLRSNAPVRIAGVNVGLVSTITARPNQKDCPADAGLELSTADELLIPNDALARIQTAGVLGESYVEIDVTRAVGPPLGNNGILKTENSRDFSHAAVDEILKRLDEAIQNCAPVQETNPKRPKSASAR